MPFWILTSFNGSQPWPNPVFGPKDTRRDAQLVIAAQLREYVAQGFVPCEKEEGVEACIVKHESDIRFEYRIEERKAGRVVLSSTDPDEDLEPEVVYDDEPKPVRAPRSPKKERTTKVRVNKQLTIDDI